MENDESEEQEQPQHPLSPHYARYIEIGERYPNNVVAQKLGDFYEIYDEYAVEISDKLDLTLTSRDFGFKSRTPLIGFPYHAAANYFNRIRQYYNVTIIDGNDIKELPQIVMVDGTMIDKETGEILNEGVCEQQTLSLLDNELLQYLNNILITKLNLCEVRKMFTIKQIRKIPKAMLERIKAIDDELTEKPNGNTRYYKYYTLYGKELAEVIVAVRNHYKKWHCKQVVVHGIHNKDVYLQDIGQKIGFAKVGWFRDGIQNIQNGTTMIGLQ